MYTKLLYIILFCTLFFLVFFLISRKFKNAVIALFSFLLGFNIAYNEIIPESYVMGSISNYRMLQIHLLDIIVLLVLIVVAYLLFKRKHKLSIIKKPFVIILTTILLQLLLSLFLHQDIVSIMWTSRLFLYFICVVLVKKYWEMIGIKERKEVVKSAFMGLIFTLTLNLIVAIFQVVFSHSIGLTVLGESPIDKHSTGIALLRVVNIYILRGYGFFAHPNVLGAFALMSLLIIDLLNKKELISINRMWLILIKVVTILIILFSFSKIIIFLALVYLLSQQFPQIKFKKLFVVLLILFLFIYCSPLVLTKIGIQSFDLRGLQTISGLKYLWNELPRSLLGTGYMGWLKVTAKNPIMLPTGSYFIQPLHNVFLLLIVEWGIMSIVFFEVIVKRIITVFKKGSMDWFILIFIGLGMFDHYCVTIPIGVLMLGIILINSKF